MRDYASSDMRPLIQVPSWDGKLVLAAMFIVGYYALVLIMAWRPLPETNAGLVRDAMLTLGPVVGLIFGSLFRNTAAEERRDALRSNEVQKALETAAAPLALPAPDLEEATANGVERGIARSEPVATAPMAADGQRRDWLDGPVVDAAAVPYTGPDLPGEDVNAPEEPAWNR